MALDKGKAKMVYDQVTPSPDELHDAHQGSYSKEEAALLYAWLLPAATPLY